MKSKLESLLDYYEDRFTILQKFGEYKGDRCDNDFRKCVKCNTYEWITYEHNKNLCSCCHNEIQVIYNQYKILQSVKDSEQFHHERREKVIKNLDKTREDMHELLKQSFNEIDELKKNK
jgi:hypothetical protein